MNKMLIVAGLVAVAGSVQAGATTAFASFQPDSNVPNIMYTGAGNTLTSVNAPVTFRFLDPLGTSMFQDVEAVFNLSTTLVSGSISDGVASGKSGAGTFSFTALTPIIYKGIARTNLLSGTFTDARLFAGGDSGTVFDSFPKLGNVTFNSSFLTFGTSTSRGFSIGITGINPAIDDTSTTAGDYAGTAAGVFSTDGSAGSPGTVPEPASWGLMVAGFGLIGVMTRRRTPRAVAA